MWFSWLLQEPCELGQWSPFFYIDGKTEGNRSPVTCLSYMFSKC